ncbi:fused MFS/spermidine synthase [Noviherbaspirillum sp. CPCC 100848]|uniref:Fused MFS/spermidine synthase n=1 Tax=Noviherbaspirillum album TaxID=3080276 RepID=A0ABU6J4F9_9BURK|nr:fused MFS/spermidine synthase [Noviherbaspirillum sp. CPCC 100848]MEC4718504.1 fused MFS/spermidine synthase [Noviherbaspirillum sp. CPCC 100848]
MTTVLFAGTIFCSAFLLFLVQPLISKQILPWFGGSAAVWATCMVFFQVVLLAGYAYADWMARRLVPRRQALVHGALLALSLLFLPIAADPAWKPESAQDPALRILLLLGATIGLPYFLLSTTGPLVQSWIARTLPDARVYRFYALSNFASLLALVSYPFLIEPSAALLLQARLWSVLYLLFVLLCAAAALRFARGTAIPSQPSGRGASGSDREASDPPPRMRDYLTWLALSAMGSWTLLAVTSHITQNIAPVPFLWLLPLTLYLLSFILCFESDRWYRRAIYLAPTALVTAFCAYALQHATLGLNLKVAVPLYAIGLLLICMLLHGELAQMRPKGRYLTRFYLMLSLGGALGGIAVSIVAPRVLPAYFELGIGFVIVACLAAWVFRRKPLQAGAMLLLAVACGYFVHAQINLYRKDMLVLVRNFYGSLRVADTRQGDPRNHVRGLYHGVIRHGEQYLDPQRRREPTSYYGRDSGIGLAIVNAGDGPRRVGLIGMGAGTLAAYGRAGDVYRFYEINPQVIDIAGRDFSFLLDSPARIETVLADARLALEKEAPQRFDVLAVDAFSGDAIPVHLLTREAIAIYLRHLRPGGVIAFHVTNRYLQLAPIVRQLADEQGLVSVLIHDDGMRSTLHKTDWVLVSQDPAALRKPALSRASLPIPSIPGLRPWTDDFNNLFQVLK